MNSSRMMRNSHSVNRETSQRKIQKDNEKLMEKLLTTKSPLSRNILKFQYKKIKEAKKRLETHSDVNKSRMKITLKKLNIKPSIYLPDLMNLSHKRISESRSTKHQR